MFHGRPHHQKGHGDADGDEHLDELSHPPVALVPLNDDLDQNHNQNISIEEGRLQSLKNVFLSKKLEFCLNLTTVIMFLHNYHD